MNRSILIVICDFLVLSLLSLVSFDTPKTDTAPAPASETTDAVRPDSDMVEALSLALQQERDTREQLLAQLARSEQQIRTQEQLLALRSKRIQEFQEDLQRKETEAQQLASQRAKLEQEIASAQSALDTLKDQLSSTSVEARISQDRLQVLQAELRRRQEESAQLQQRLGQLEKNQRATEAEKQQLATQLQVAETEKRLARAQIDAMQTEVQIVRAEKAQLQEQTAKLSQGVTELAEKSQALKEEIRQNRPLAPNTIFSEFVANRIAADFQAIRRGLFGREVARDRETKTILISDGSNTFALFHITETPLQFADPGTDWDWLTGNLRRKSAVVPIDHFWFLQTDPRVVVAPIPAQETAGLQAKIYPLTQDPYKFQDAVVVGATEGYYGECKFQIDPALPNYVKMEHSTIKGLFGKFNPSQGDLVFAKTGELLGLMVNDQYCAVINNFTRIRGIKFGIDVTAQKTGLLLAELRWRLDRLPLALH